MDHESIGVLPANIQKTYNAFLEEKMPTRRMELMLDVFKQTIQFFGCLFLSEYLWDKERNDESVNAKIRQMARPSLGTWYDLVRTYGQTYCRKDRSWLDGFWRCYCEISQSRVQSVYHGRFRDEKSQVGSPFDEIIMLRNQIAHGAQYPSSTEAEEILTIYDSYLEDILTSFQPFFQRYKVAKCIRANDFDEESKEDCWIAWFDIIHYDIVENENYCIRWPVDTTELGPRPELFFDTGAEWKEEKAFYLLDMEKPLRILRFSEILIELLASDLEEKPADHEDYLIYDGYGNSDVTYVGVLDRRKLTRYLETIRTRFTERGSNLHWTHHDFDMSGFRKYVNELSQIAVDIHKDSGKYLPEIYSQRSCDDIIGEFLDSDKTTVLVQAEAGVGKTCFLCHTAENLMRDRERYAVYFFNGNFFSSLSDTDNQLFKRLESECLENNAFLSSKEFLDYINEKNREGIRLVLIVDAANEAYDTLSILHEIDEITTQCGKYPWLKIIVSIRSISYELLQSHVKNNMGKDFRFVTTPDRFYSVIQNGKKVYYLNIERWNQLQASDAYKKYATHHDQIAKITPYESLERDLKDTLTNPLNMRLFFDLASTIQNTDIHTDEDLFRTLDQWIQADSKDDTQKLQSQIVAHMLDHKKNMIDADTVDKDSDALIKNDNDKRSLIILTPIERLLDKGIIYEKEIHDENGSCRMVAFVYQKYLEYLIRQTVNKNIALESLIDQIITSQNWGELPEAFLAYCAVLEQFEDCGQALRVILDKLSEKQTAFESMRPVFTRYCVKNLVKIDEATQDRLIREVVSVMGNNGISSWSVDMVEMLRHQAQSSLAEKLAIAIIEREDTPEAIRRDMLFHQAMICQNRSQYDETIGCLQKAGDGEQDAAMRNRINVQLAKTRRKKGEVSEAESILEELIQNGSEETPFYPEALIQRGLCDVEKSNYEDAMDDYETALRIARDQKDYHTVAYDLLGISTIYRHNGEKDQQKKALLEIYEISNKYGYLDLLSDCLHALAKLYLDDQNYEEAGRYTDQAILLWERSGHNEGLAVMYIIRAIIEKVSGKKGDAEIADKSLNRAKELHAYIKNNAVEREYEHYFDVLEHQSN